MKTSRVFSLEDAKSQTPQPIGRQGWKTIEEIGLLGENAIEWNCYFGILVSNYIILREDESVVLC
jgi:hypothetical protein